MPTLSKICDYYFSLFLVTFSFLINFNIIFSIPLIKENCGINLLEKTIVYSIFCSLFVLTNVYHLLIKILYYDNVIWKFAIIWRPNQYNSFHIFCLNNIILLILGSLSFSQIKDIEKINDNCINENSLKLLNFEREFFIWCNLSPYFLIITILFILCNLFCNFNLLQASIPITMEIELNTIVEENEPTKLYGDGENVQCIICLSSSITCLTCGHIICESCFPNLISKSCPVCRKKINYLFPITDSLRETLVPT